ncbi:FHF complex subunit HOOK interacting protein 2B isoform X2 [Protopterus annectens]|nr:FHF complex subunit HOOK interacting protein 2B isoform X2 [Protopterus annectens]
MLDILVYEEKKHGSTETGPCMEYLLQHKILETLCTLGKAEYPPGMKQQVVLFFSKILGQIQQPMLNYLNVHRPVKKLIHLCGEDIESTCERDEAQFLGTVCAKINQDPRLLSHIMENKNATAQRRESSGPDNEAEGQQLESQMSTLPSAAGHKTASSFTGADSGHGHSVSVSTTALECSTLAPKMQKNLIDALIKLCRSKRKKIALKACESLLLLVCIQKLEVATLLIENTALCQLVISYLCDLYCCIPTSLDPAVINLLEKISWRAHYNPSPSEGSSQSAVKEVVEAFLAWYDYCNTLVVEAHAVIAGPVAAAIHKVLFIGILQPQLLQVSELGILSTTVLLTTLLQQTTSEALLEELVFFLLGKQRVPEVPLDLNNHLLCYQLIENCDHLSDEISIATLHVFEQLLQKPHEHIVHSLVLRNLQDRSYVSRCLVGQEDKTHTDQEHFDEAEELEEDPYFTDGFPDTGFRSSTVPSFPSSSEESEKADGKEKVTKIVNSFLCLVPEEAKTSHHFDGTGYDTYVHDAHGQFQQCCSHALSWNWPLMPKPLDTTESDVEFYEGHFLKILFDRLARLLDQPYELNLQVTSVLSKLALFPHPHLHEYLLDPYVNLASGCRSLFSVLVRVIAELMQRIQRIPDIRVKLVMVRKQLTGHREDEQIDHTTLLKGVIVLEEFCKELAAIALVKYPSQEPDGT